MFISHIEARQLSGQPVEDHGNSCWDYFVTCQLFADGEPLCLPEQTCFKPLIGRPSWNDWLHFPVTVDALPLSCVAVFNVWDCGTGKDARPVVVGGTSIPVFHSSKGTMVKGRKKLFLWKDRVADAGSVSETVWDAAQEEESDRLEKCLIRYEKQKFQRIGWLDAQSFTQIRVHQERMSRRMRPDVAFLHVEFPYYAHNVVFHQKEFVTSVNECSTNEVVHVFDPDISQTNPVEEKFLRMLRFQVGMGTNMKPTIAEKKELARIVNAPPTRQLTEAEKNMLWMFRVYLKSSVPALPKILLSVDWNVEDHSKEALKLMESWPTLTVEVALELLSDAFGPDAMRNEVSCGIRSHAVKFLDTQSDAELSNFLLQLVQVIRSERTETQKPVLDFLVARGKKSKLLGTRLLWNLKVEAEAADDDGVWYRSVVSLFMQEVKEEKVSMFHMFQRQEALVRMLKDLYKFLTEHARNRVEMIDVMRREIESGTFSKLKSFDPLTFPLNPDVEVKGMIPEKCSVFKSAQKPLGLCFEKTDGSPYMVIFKVGDDLRCDQLVLQIILLMDEILKRDGNLDLCLSPYHVLATGKGDGMIEMVPNSISVAACLKAHDNDIAAYFRKLHPKTDGPFGIQPKILDNFVRSCAGYCVITFLLGVGDRHLDNLLLTSTGLLFHIDFGFILGEDPKSWPPPMKITREMVMAMGGDNSEHYYQFRNLCCESYTLLRRRSNLVITLFDLMLHAGVLNGHKVFNNRNDLFKIQEKYALDDTEEAAIETLQQLLQRSVAALMPRLFEDFHSWAQYWRQ